MLKNFARVLAVGAFVLTAAIPTTASAAGGPGVGMTLTIGSPITLTDRLLVQVPVVVTCTTPLANPVNFGGVFVTVQQAAGRSIAAGFGFANLTTCPTSPTTVVVNVLPNGGMTGPPFHGGNAIVSASASACDTAFVCVGGSAGPVSVRI
jgi:hypothetical protein